MRGRCVAKERKEIESVTWTENRIRLKFNFEFFFFFDKPKCLKTLNYPNLLHRYESLSEKLTTRIFHTKLHLGYEWDIFHIFNKWRFRWRHYFVFPLFFLFSKHSYLCNKKKITRWLEHMKFILSWKKDFTRSLHSPVKYFFHSKINFICSRQNFICS